MTVQVSKYTVTILFPRLYADPRFLGKDANLPRQYLILEGLSREKAQAIVSREFKGPLDDRGNPSRIAGHGTHVLEGKRVRSEYMKDARFLFSYLDVGSGLKPVDHSTLWKIQRWWNMEFHLENIEHVEAAFEMPDLDELYSMVKGQASPTTIASVELSQVEPKDFDFAVAYLENQLRSRSEKDSFSLEVYASKDLDPRERMALDRRLTRQSTETSVYLILGG